MLRYVERDGWLRKIIARGSGHSDGMRLYDITAHGLEVGRISASTQSKDSARAFRRKILVLEPQPGDDR